jgi:hypothetical protein
MAISGSGRVIERNRRSACCPIIGEHGLRKESIERYFGHQMIKKIDDEKCLFDPLFRAEGDCVIRK